MTPHRTKPSAECIVCNDPIRSGLYCYYCECALRDIYKHERRPQQLRIDFRPEYRQVESGPFETRKRALQQCMELSLAGTFVSDPIERGNAWFVIALVTS